MLFRNIYLKSVRDYRIAVLGWGIGMGILMYAVLASFPTLVETPEARASLVSLGPSFAWLAEPLKIDTTMAKMPRKPESFVSCLKAGWMMFCDEVTAGKSWGSFLVVKSW